MIGVHQDYIDLKVCDGIQDDVHIHAARMHAELRAPAQCAHQQLALHLIGVGDQNANRIRSGNVYGFHKIHIDVITACVNDRGRSDLECCDIATPRAGPYLCGKLQEHVAGMRGFPDIALRPVIATVGI